MSYTLPSYPASDDVINHQVRQEINQAGLCKRRQHEGVVTSMKQASAYSLCNYPESLCKNSIRTTSDPIRIETATRRAAH